MSSVLLNLAMILGFFLFIISMVIGLSNGVSFWAAMYRSAIVLSIGTVAIIAFFRYFNVILFQFLAEKLEERRKQEEEEAEEEEEMSELDKDEAL